MTLNIITPVFKLTFFIFMSFFCSMNYAQENPAKQRGKGELCALKFSFVHSANKNLISDEQCQYIIPADWELAKLERDANKEIASLSLKSLQLMNMKFAFRVKGAGDSFINLRSGDMQFMLNGTAVESSFVITSLILKDRKDKTFVLQSAYCNAELRLQSNCAI